MTPDNWAISPIGNVTGDATVRLYARGQDPDYVAEHFAIYAAKADEAALGENFNPAKWTKISEEYVATGNYTEYTGDLSAFAGENVYVAIRHFNVTDEYYLNIDHVSLPFTAPKPKTDLSKANVIVSTENKNVTVRLDGGLIDEKNYDVSYTGETNKGEGYSSPEFPTDAGTYKATVTGKGDFEGEATSDEFTIVTYDLVEENDPDCTTPGNIAYYRGTDGNLYTYDEINDTYEPLTDLNNDGEINEVDTLIDPLGHTAGDPVIENRVEPDCVNDGSYEEVVYCTVCGDEISRETKTIPATGHTEGDPVIENRVEPDCVNDGSYDEVVYCSVCGEEISRETKTIPATGHTEGDPVIENRVEPDCVNDGSYDEVVYCSVCGEELSRETKTIPALGHDEAEAVMENVVPATYTSDGSYDLVVYCTRCGEELSRIHMTVPKLSVPAPMWKWNADYTAATATFKGANNDPSTTLDATITYSVPVAPTCTEKGKELYLASVKFLGKTYTNHVWNILGPTGHSYGEPEWTWADDNTSATAVFICENCGDKQTATATVTSKVVDPTYTKDGKTVYTATATFGGKTYTSTKEVKIDKLAYTAPTVTYKKGDGAVKLNWTAVDGAEKYAICGYVNGKWQKLGTGTGTTYILDNLAAGKEYKVAVLAKVGGEWVEDYSNAITVTPKAAAPKYPTVTNIENNEQYHQIRISWNAVPGAEKYGVAVLVAGKWKIAAQDIPAGTTTYTSPKLTELKTYKMVICAKINGKWDTSNLNARAFEVTVK